MQSDKTLQFWDKYHIENGSQEWISTPGEQLLQLISDQMELKAVNDNSNHFRDTNKKRVVSILEIGCGTSTLIRDLKNFVEEKYPYVQVIACGTDVSQVCIDINLTRDLVPKHQRKSDDTSEWSRSLWYEVLNVLDGEPSRRDWDLIIDKGCIDTFLFRSRQRGSQNKSYPEALRRVLDNLHKWMATENCNTRSRYILISPRSKLKAIRDYTGFLSVTKYALPDGYRAQLEGRKSNVIQEDTRMSRTSRESVHSSGFMFVCTRNDDYEAGVSEAFPSDYLTSGPAHSNLPSDTSQCAGCNVTFLGFRKAEGLEYRGAAYWRRRWNAHCVHCKGS